jgi:uncharacterized membrane protein YhhN
LPVVPSVAVLVSAALAIFGAERGVRWMTAAFKPLTTVLLFFVLGWPETTYAQLIAAGIALSVVGDVALLWPGNRPFIVGLAAFLLAHVAYVIAFLGVAVFSAHVVGVALVTAATTILTLRAIWPGAAGMHGPTLAYGVVISAMVIAASATLGGSLSRAYLSAVGAVLFYISDTSLALDRFRAKIPHAALLTQGIYWLGQLGIALSAV